MRVTPQYPRRWIQHEPTHSDTREYVQQQCDEPGTSSEALIQNNRDVHTEDKPHRCGHLNCDKTFKSKHELRIHERIHTGEKPYQCEICKKSFRQRSHLNKHKMLHSSERPYKCDECTATYKYPHQLTMHTRIHTRGKPHICEICGKAFARNFFLSDHRFIHSDKRQFACSMCGKGYKQERSLRRHMQTVSWMRKRDMHILSAGIFMYTSDLRFQVIHPDKSENWTLQIKSPQQRDSGVYECQVSTEPKMSLNYSLNVVEARARIHGQADIYVKTGSLLTLTCLMSQGPHDLGTVAWYRESQAVVTSPRSENDIETEPRITVETEWSDALTSRLRITHVKPSDSGNYSCVPTVAEGASVIVHVINGEHPAAMQHGNTAAGSPNSKTVLVMLAFLLGQLR